jgi:hypothetical protein
MVALEARRAQIREYSAQRDAAGIGERGGDNPERHRCMDTCIDRMESSQREVLLGYYQDDGRAKIDRRRQLAASAGIPMNALRIRVHRLRTHIEECVTRCLEGRK